MIDVLHFVFHKIIKEPADPMENLGSSIAFFILHFYNHKCRIYIFLTLLFKKIYNNIFPLQTKKTQQTLYQAKFFNDAKVPLKN